jgi:hypothetical protein
MLDVVFKITVAVYMKARARACWVLIGGEEGKELKRLRKG